MGLGIKNIFLGKKNYLLYKTVRLFSCRFFTDTRTAKCWTKITNNRCEEAINGAVSLETCCNTVGKGWGSPCTECPAKTGGMLLSLELRVFCFFLRLIKLRYFAIVVVVVGFFFLLSLSLSLKTRVFFIVILFCSDERCALGYAIQDQPNCTGTEILSKVSTACVVRISSQRIYDAENPLLWLYRENLFALLL